MAVEVYDDNEQARESLRKALIAYECPGVRVINVHLKQCESDLPGFCNGLNVALAFDPQEGPIILCSALTRVELAGDMRLHALLGTRGIGFMKMPLLVQAVIHLADKLANDEKVEDLLAWKLSKGFKRIDLMVVLRHGLRNALRSDNEDRMREILNTARNQAGMTGSDEEVIDEIADYREGLCGGMFPEESFPGVFCDIEGTLLLVRNMINNKMVDTLHSHEQDGQPITLWSGGDIGELSEKMILAGLPWKVIPKRILTGSKVQTVYDDEPSETFTEKYNIGFEEFNQV